MTTLTTLPSNLNSGYIEQTKENDGPVIISSRMDSENFDRLKATTKYSNVWATITMDQIKNNKRSAIKLELDKKQLEFLISQLSDVAASMTTRPEIRHTEDNCPVF